MTDSQPDPPRRFGRFEIRRTLGAGAFATVYEADLVGIGGFRKPVALKVQRPDMIRAVSLDLYLLRNYCLFVEWFKVRVLTGVLGAADRTPSRPRETAAGSRRNSAKKYHFRGPRRCRA